MSEESTLYRLINPEFDFEWNGKVYHVRKAGLEQIVLYKQKARELSDAKDVGADEKLAAYCIYLILRSQAPDLTEQMVFENTTGDIDTLELVIQLGFINPAKVKLALQNLTKKPISENSLQPSQNEPDGQQEKSGN